MTTTRIVVEQSSGTDWPTLILAALGVGLALLSLAWQAVSFLMTGSRISVEVRAGLRGIGAVVTLPHSATPQSLAHVQSQGFTDPVFAVAVNNSGRGATSIVSVDLAFDDGGSIGQGILDPPLPFRLDGESAQSWYFDAGPAVAYARTMEEMTPTGRPSRVRGRVVLGSKRVVMSKNYIPIPTGAGAGPGG